MENYGLYLMQENLSKEFLENNKLKKIQLLNDKKTF